jgi:hypothetical protein
VTIFTVAAVLFALWVTTQALGYTAAQSGLILAISSWGFGFLAGRSRQAVAEASHETESHHGDGMLAFHRLTGDERRSPY